jgi:hypothetical protein
VWRVLAVMARHRIHFAPPSLCCPHCGGRAQGLLYHSTYRTRDGPRRLWQCGECGRCLSERRGTAFFNLKTPELEVSRSLDAMLRGDTQTSTAQTRRHRRDTLRRWRGRAAPRARAVDSDFVTDLCVTDLELDEQWSFAGRKKAEFADSSGVARSGGTRRLRGRAVCSSSSSSARALRRPPKCW